MNSAGFLEILIIGIKDLKLILLHFGTHGDTGVMMKMRLGIGQKRSTSIVIF